MSAEINIEKNHRIEAPKKVADFLSASQNNDPMLYPGQRPENSYLTDGSLVYDLEARDTDSLSFTLRTAEGEEVNMDDFLREHGVPTLEERIPVLAFGANLSPGSLASKFAKVGRKDALFIPTAYTTLINHDVVWSGGPGMNGNFIAVLYAGPEVEGTEVQVGINFLTREQLLVMNATELSYQLAWADVSIEGHPVRAYYYVGQDQIYIKDGSPLAIESVPAKNRSIDESNTTELLNEVINNKAIVDRVSEEFPDLAEVETVEDYIALARALRAEKRSLKLKKAVHDALADEELAVQVAPEGVLHRMESWANPSTLPTLGDQQLGFFHHPIYRLPTQELGEWKDTEARARLLRSITAHIVRHSGGRLIIDENRK